MVHNDPFSNLEPQELAIEFLQSSLEKVSTGKEAPRVLLFSLFALKIFERD